MKPTWFLTLPLLFLTLSGCGTETGTETEPEARPNILLIVADDLGYSDVGAFGGEIRTPTIDRLGEEGLRFSGFHVLPTCSPTRSALLSGNDNHVAGLGVMGEFIYPEIADRPGYAGHLADRFYARPATTPTWPGSGTWVKRTPKVRTRAASSRRSP
jgi:arylsulfatase